MDLTQLNSFLQCLVRKSDTTNEGGAKGGIRWIDSRPLRVPWSMQCQCSFVQI
jgi:hypothetical protein